MKRLYKVIVVFSLAAFLLLTTATVAPAQTAGPFYVGIFGGLVVPDDMEFDDGWSSWEEEMDESWAIGAKFGYIIPPTKWLAVELEYTYLADQDYGETFSPVDNYSGDFSAHNVMANLLFRYPQGKIHPYVGFGLGISTATLEENLTLDGVSVYNYDDDDTAFASQFIAGVNFEIAPNISADLAYKYFYSEYDFNDYYGIDTDVEAGNHLFTAGINFHF